MLPTGYREFNGQIAESDGEIEISLSSKNPSMAWRIAGPSENISGMMEYLALRVALDLNPDLIKASGLDAAPSDRDLAFAMGNQAFRQQRYERAQAFYILADHFAPLDEKVDAMLGLAHYQAVSEDAGADPGRFEAAVHSLEAAVNQDPNADSSLLRPYLVCLYYKASMHNQAEEQRVVFNRYLRRLEFLDFDVRSDALKQIPLHSSGRHLSAAGDDVIFVDERGNITGAAGQPLDANLSLPDQNPRQISLSGASNLLFISPDGAVFSHNYQSPEENQTPTVLVEGRALGGVQQISNSGSEFGRTNLFLLNREGEIYWCEPDAEPGSTNACPPRRSIEAPDARQIFPVEDQLFILAADGAVWHTDVNLSGRTSKAQPLTAAAPVQEIFVADDSTLYLLHDNGTVWRYYDDGRPETEDIKLVDPGTGTAQIFAAASDLYLLKSGGAVWRIRNPRSPNPDNDFTEISLPPQDVTIQEMFVTIPEDDNATTSNRSLYLLTDQRLLLKGTDSGDARVTFSQVAFKSPDQMATTQ